MPRTPVLLHAAELIGVDAVSSAVISGKDQGTISPVGDSTSSQVITQALDNLVRLGEMNRTGADAFFALSDGPDHRQARRAILIMHWKAADDRAEVDPKTAERIRHELKVTIEALGWHLGIDFP